MNKLDFVLTDFFDRFEFNSDNFYTWILKIYNNKIYYVYLVDDKGKVISHVYLKLQGNCNKDIKLINNCFNKLNHDYNEYIYKFKYKASFTIYISKDCINKIDYCDLKYKMTKLYWTILNNFCFNKPRYVKNLKYLIVLSFELYLVIKIILLFNDIICLDNINYINSTDLSNASDYNNMGYNNQDDNITNDDINQSRLDMNKDELKKKNYNAELQNQVINIIKDKPEKSSTFNKLSNKIKGIFGIPSPEHKQIKKYSNRNIDNRRRDALQKEVSKNLEKNSSLKKRK